MPEVAASQLRVVHSQLGRGSTALRLGLRKPSGVVQLCWTAIRLGVWPFRAERRQRKRNRILSSSRCTYNKHSLDLLLNAVSTEFWTCCSGEQGTIRSRQWLKVSDVQGIDRNLPRKFMRTRSFTYDNGDVEYTQHSRKFCHYFLSGTKAAG